MAKDVVCAGQVLTQGLDRGQVTADPRVSQRRVWYSSADPRVSQRRPQGLSAPSAVPGLTVACSWMRGVRLGKTVLRGFDGKIAGFTS